MCPFYASPFDLSLVIHPYSEWQNITLLFVGLDTAEKRRLPLDTLRTTLDQRTVFQTGSCNGLIILAGDAKALIQDLGFKGKIVIYNFLGTPHTSMLVDANGLIRVTGINDDDDVIIGELKSFSLDSFSEVVIQHKHSKGMNCFTWKHWDNNVLLKKTSIES